jgi:hypothetical protein
MKLKILDRVLLTLYTMVILMLSLGLLGLSVGLIPLEAALQWVQNMNVGLGLGLTAFAAAVIFMVVSLRLLIAGFMRGKPASTLLKHTELGAIRVSVQTLDNLAQKAVRSFAEIKDVRSMVLPEADAVMMLRVQRERMSGGFFPTAREYTVGYGLTRDRLGLLREGAPILHPGPMNRGLEIAADAADAAGSAVLDQVSAGVAVRMSVLYHLLAGEGSVA